MPVTDQQAAALRAQLAGDLAGHRRLVAGLGGPADDRGYGGLLTTAFYTAVESRFTRDSPANEVTGFVADVRARSKRVREALDPRTAERLIVSAFTGDGLDDLSPEELTTTKMVLLAAIIAGQHLDDAGLDESIAKARALAGELSGSGRVHGFGELVSAAFVTAARPRFSPTWTSAQVVRFAGRLRIVLRAYDVDLDPRAIEILLRQALGEGVNSDYDDGTHAWSCCPGSASSYPKRGIRLKVEPLSLSS